MRRSDQQRLIRWVFVCAALLPTLGLAAWSAARHWPGTTAATALALGQKLHLAASLERISYPRPEVTHYHELRLSDPETGALVAQCRLLEVTTTPAAQVATISQGQIVAAQAHRLTAAIQQSLRRSAIGHEPPLRIVASEVEWQLPTHSHLLTYCTAQFDAGEPRSQWLLRVRLADAEATEPVTLRLVRERGQGEPLSRLTLETGDGPLPVALLGPWLPEALRETPATWRGYLTLEQTSAIEQGELVGELRSVELGALAAPVQPGMISGRGDLILTRARWEQGRLVDASGRLMAGPGEIHAKLVTAVQRELGIGREELPLPQQVRFEELALGFVVDQRGLMLQGLSPRVANAILTASEFQPLGRVLWLDASSRWHPHAALLRAVVAGADSEALATRQSDWLIRHLPLPRVPLVARSEPSESQAPSQASESRQLGQPHGWNPSNEPHEPRQAYEPRELPQPQEAEPSLPELNQPAPRQRDPNPLPPNHLPPNNLPPLRFVPPGQGAAAPLIAPPTTPVAARPWSAR